MKVDSYDSLSLEKTMTFGNVIIIITSVCNKDKNNYWHKMFLEKALNNIPKNKFLHKI